MNNGKWSWGPWKRRSVIIVAILAFLVAPWQSYGQSPAAAPDLRLLASSEQAIVLELRVPAWEVSSQEACTEPCRSVGEFLLDEISVPGFSHTSDPGTPRLPVKFVTLGIPPGVTPQVQVLEATWGSDDGPWIVTGYRLAANPSPTLKMGFDLEAPPSIATLSGPPQLQVEPASGDALYPAELAQIVEVGRLRSQSFVQIRLNPFQYHPQKQELHVYDRLQVAVKFGLFGISQGHGVEVPNLLGVWRGAPQQVGDSGSLPMPTPKDPKFDAPAPGFKGGLVDEGPFEFVLRSLLLNYAEAKAWRALPGNPARVVSSQYLGGKGGIASIRRLSRPSGRIETQDASGSTDNPLGLDTSLVSIRLRLLNTSRSYSAGAGFVLPRLFEKIPRVNVQDFYTGIRFRIEVSVDGLYELDRNLLQAPDIGDYLLNTFQLFEDFNLSAASEVVLEIVDNGGDDRFDFGDVIRFYGRTPDEEELRYTGTRVYWLAAGREPGKRMATRSGLLGSGAIPADFPTRVHVEENHRYFWNLPELGGSDAHWYWAYLVHSDPNSPLQRDYTVSTPGVSPVGHQFTVRAKLVGFSSNSGVNPDHWVKLYLSHSGPDTLVADHTWDGQIGVDIEGDAASSKLNSGANTIRLEIHLLPNIATAALFVDWFEIDYRQTFVAQQDRLTFTRPTGYSEYQVTGFGSSDVGVYDITDPRNPVELTDTQTDLGGILRFRDETPAAEKYVAVRLQKPALMEPNSVARVEAGADLRAPGIGANYLIITHADFTAAANQLASFRAAAFTALVIQVQDIYNQFGNGMLDPEAIHDFLAYAIDNWSPSPQYVLLMGDGSYDYRDYLGEPRANYIPPYQAMVDPWLGETADENYYAAVSGADIVPDLFVGRAPVNALAEATAVVGKIMGYESGLSLRASEVGLSQSVSDSALFVADNYEPGTGAGNFPRLADAIAADCLPDSYAIQKVYYGETHATVGSVRSAIISNIDQGQRFVNYIGHAGVTLWAAEGFFVNSDVDGLSNVGKFPVVLAMTCLEGSFQDVYQDAVAERLVRGANKGAVASWSPTGLGVATGHDKLSRGFYDALFQEDARRLGVATVAGKVQLYNSGSNLDLIHTFALLGDPATDTGIRACLADVNDDGAVDIVDTMLVASRWRTSCANPDPDDNPDTPNYEAQYDLDDDCDIDIVDIMLVVARWGDPC